MTHRPNIPAVDVFIVGEPKSGTTALASFLDQHPDIDVSRPKEPHYFATDLIRESDEFHGGSRRHFEVRTPDEYAACFAHSAPSRHKVDASTHYLTSHEAARNIHAYNPDAKIIILLREPVSFVRSLHQQYVNNGTEDEPDFRQALAKEPARKHGAQIPAHTRCPSHLYYSERVKYADHIQRFLDVFPRDQILVLLQEEFMADNEATYRSATEFIGIDSTFTPVFSHVHGSKAPRNRVVHRLLNNSQLKQSVRSVVGAQRYDKFKHAASSVFLKQQPRTALDPALRQRLKTAYTSEVTNVARLINRPDLPALWHY